MIRAIKIDAEAHTMGLITMENDLDAFYREIGCQVMEAVYPRILHPQDRLYVDEEGLLTPGKAFFKIEGFIQPLAGNGLIVGHDAEGESVDAHTPFATVWPKVTFLGRARA